jgi:hypothetical protein
MNGFQNPATFKTLVGEREREREREKEREEVDFKRECALLWLILKMR